MTNLSRASDDLCYLSLWVHQLPMRARTMRGGRLLLTLVAITFLGCSIHAEEAPTSPFLSHAEELEPHPERAPWDAIWSSRPGSIIVEQSGFRRIYIAPVNTDYLNMVQDESCNWVRKREVKAKDVEAITSYLREAFIKALVEKPEAHLVVEDRPGPKTMTLTIALTELEPTNNIVNGVTNAGAVAFPGATLLENAAAVTAPIAGGAIAAGSIAIEMKLTDGNTGAVLAEIKDREKDPASVIPNYRDFLAYGWSRRTIQEWAQQLAEQFSTPASEKIDGRSDISLFPW